MSTYGLPTLLEISVIWTQGGILRGRVPQIRREGQFVSAHPDLSSARERTDKFYSSPLLEHV